jgi:hypothetical protein
VRRRRSPDHRAERLDYSDGGALRQRATRPIHRSPTPRPPSSGPRIHTPRPAAPAPRLDGFAASCALPPASSAIPLAEVLESARKSPPHRSAAALQRPAAILTLEQHGIHFYRARHEFHLVFVSTMASPSTWRDRPARAGATGGSALNRRWARAGRPTGRGRPDARHTGEVGQQGEILPPALKYGCSSITSASPPRWRAASSPLRNLCVSSTSHIVSRRFRLRSLYRPSSRDR